VPQLADQTSNRHRCAIAIMAKAPQAGRVKTRLSPLLSPDEARDLGCCFLRDMTTNLATAAHRAAIDPYIAFAPAGSEAAFASMVAPGTRFVLADGVDVSAGVEGFGRCLYQAAHALFAAGYGTVGMLNSDSPTLPTSLLEEAARLAAQRPDRVVLGPSDDGGYYLIVMRAPHPELFAGIDWSTDRVAAQTRAQARALGLDLVELQSWYDIDDPESLSRLVDEVERADAHGAGPQPYAAPFTAGWLRRNAIAERLPGHMRRDAGAGASASGS
jgi:rSAM/selenodomain-associated transferase 1